MNRGSVLLLLFSVMTAGAAGCAWLAQISGYPLWKFVGNRALAPFLSLWTSASFGFLILPPVVMMLFSLALLRSRPAGISPLVVGCWLIVSLLIVYLSLDRCSAAGLIPQAGGMNQAEYAQLLLWGWLRTGLLTLLAISAQVELYQHLGRGTEQFATGLLVVTTAFGVAGAAQVWMVQMLCYRLWPTVDRSAFYGYHFGWWHSIWISIFIPAGVTLIGILFLLRFPPAGVEMRWMWTAFALQMLLGITTGAWWGPLMARLATEADGLLLDRYALLMSTHWARVAIVTAYALVMLGAMLECVPVS